MIADQCWNDSREESTIGEDDWVHSIPMMAGLFQPPIVESQHLILHETLHVGQEQTMTPIVQEGEMVLLLLVALERFRKYVLQPSFTTIASSYLPQLQKYLPCFCHISQLSFRPCSSFHARHDNFQQSTLILTDV
jgi:hypothetical protein